MFWIRIVEGDSHHGPSNAALSLLEDKLLIVFGTDILQMIDSEQEANAVQDVWFARTVETSDSVELSVKFIKTLILSIAFEAVDFYLRDVHI